MTTEEIHDYDQAMFRLMRELLETSFLSHEEAVAQLIIETKLEKAGF